MLRKQLWPVAPVTLALVAGALWLRSEAQPASGNTAPTSIDVSGDWNAHFTADPPFSDFDCSATFVQTGSEVTGQGNCGALAIDEIHDGVIKQQGDGAHFSFSIRPKGIEISVDGKVDPDGNHASGTWDNGEFTAERKLSETETPTAAPTTAATMTPPAPTSTPPPGATNTPVPAVTSTPLPTPAGGVPGDASCDGLANSIDAALVLQFGAALLTSLPCAGNANVNHDSSINSLDAALILQFSAGLLTAFP